MPPFITGPDGRTGYYQNGQFVEMNQQQYNSQFNPTANLINGGNPFTPQAPVTQPQQEVQIGTMPQGMTNEQKLGVQSNNTVPLDENATNLRFGQHSQGMGFTNNNGQFFPSNAMSASGHPMIKGQGVTNPIWDYTGQKANNMQQTQQGVSDVVNTNGNPYGGAGTMNTAGAGAGLGNIFGSFGGGASAAEAGAGLGNAGVGAAGAGAGLGSAAGSGAGAGLGSAGAAAVNNAPTVTPKPGMTALQKSQLTGMAINAGAKLVNTMLPGKYDDRVGMTKPNAVGTILGDGTFTQIGSTFGPVGLAVGGAVDLVKNTIKYKKNKDIYQNKKLGVDTQDQMRDASESSKVDFTGYARYGTEVINPFLKKKDDVDDDVKKYRDGGPLLPTLSKQKEQSWNPYENIKNGLPALNNQDDFGNVIPDNTINTGGFSWSGQPINTSQVGSTESSSISRTIPSAVNNAKAGAEETRIFNTTNDTKKIIQDIYNSEGYQKRLKNEIEESKLLGYGDTYGDGTKKNLRHYELVDERQTFERLHKNRNDRLKNIEVWGYGSKEKQDPELSTYYGYMREQGKGFNPFTQKYKMYTDVYLNPKSTLRDNDDEFMATIAEEIEHNNHIKNTSGDVNYFTSSNITPKAKKVFDDNIDPLASTYLKTYTENLAKKRAAEVFFISKGMLKPGEDVNDKHFEYLMDNYDTIPTNVRDVVTMIGVNKNTKTGYSTYKNESKIPATTKMAVPKSAIPNSYLKNANLYKGRFKNIMNTTAASEKQQNPFLNYG
jgi:hypothetical protein